jgi:hypothetical protein
MIRRPLPAALILLALLAAPASAKVADPRFSRVSTALAGCPSGEALPTRMTGGGVPESRVLGFRVEAREINNAPLPYEEVTLDFSRTSIRLLADDSPGTTVNCVSRTVTMLTDLHGVATFRPRFCGSTATPDVVVHVDGVYLRELPACSTDMDGDGTTGLGDFTRFASSYNAGTVDPATNFDASTPETAGHTTLADFVIFTKEFLRSASGTSACP